MKSEGGSPSALGRRPGEGSRQSAVGSTNTCRPTKRRRYLPGCFHPPVRRMLSMIALQIRSAPFGGPRWAKRTVAELGLESTVRRRRAVPRPIPDTFNPPANVAFAFVPTTVGEKLIPNGSSCTAPRPIQPKATAAHRPPPRAAMVLTGAYARRIRWMTMIALLCCQTLYTSSGARVLFFPRIRQFLCQRAS